MGIGVAPEVTWIACKGCNSNSCSGSALYACGQWVQCPTDTNGNNADCTKAPNVFIFTFLSMNPIIALLKNIHFIFYEYRWFQIAGVVAVVRIGMMT